jgi:hypothetical protein
VGCGLRSGKRGSSVRVALPSRLSQTCEFRHPQTQEDDKVSHLTGGILNALVCFKVVVHEPGRKLSNNSTGWWLQGKPQAHQSQVTPASHIRGVHSLTPPAAAWRNSAIVNNKHLPRSS